MPQEPTTAQPGTEQKIQVMVERAARREQLFHPQDGAFPASTPLSPVVHPVATVMHGPVAGTNGVPAGDADPLDLDDAPEFDPFEDDGAMTPLDRAC
jgi:hypothetical protein